jgi:hypothetical protein
MQMYRISIMHSHQWDKVAIGDCRLRGLNAAVYCIKEVYVRVAD